MEAAESGFGNAFVSAREQMGLSQREVAEELKLAWKTIESLESEDFESLPPYVFVRGYVKSYSKLVGIDADEMASKLVSFYQGIEREARVNEQDKTNGFRSPASSLNPTSLLTGFALVVITVVLFVAYTTWIDQSQIPSEISINDDNQINEESFNPVSTKEEIGLGASNSGSDRDEDDSYKQESQRLENDASGEILDEAPQLSSVEGPVREGGASEIDESLEVLSPDGDDFDLLGEGGDDELEIQFNDDCWFEISDTQQNLLTADLGRSGDSRFYRGTAPFRIKLGYAPGVIIRFNGNNVELAPYTRNNIAVFNLRRRVDSVE